jgi:hypothetical protein
VAAVKGPALPGPCDRPSVVRMQPKEPT